MFQNALRRISVVLYRLKRQYGQRIVFYQFDSQTNNVETGEIERKYNTFVVRRAILLPENIDRSFVYDLTYIAANNNFVGGGLFDRRQKNIIIDAKDLSTVPTMDDHVEFDSRRYEILSFATLEHRKGYLLQLQDVDSSEPVGS